MKRVNPYSRKRNTFKSDRRRYRRGGMPSFKWFEKEFLSVNLNPFGNKIGGINQINAKIPDGSSHATIAGTVHAHTILAPANIVANTTQICITCEGIGAAGVGTGIWIAGSVATAGPSTNDLHIPWENAAAVYNNCESYRIVAVGLKVIPISGGADTQGVTYGGYTTRTIRDNGGAFNSIAHLSGDLEMEYRDIQKGITVRCPYTRANAEFQTPLALVTDWQLDGYRAYSMPVIQIQNVVAATRLHVFAVMHVEMRVSRVTSAIPAAPSPCSPNFDRLLRYVQNERVQPFVVSGYSFKTFMSAIGNWVGRAAKAAGSWMLSNPSRVVGALRSV